VGHEHQLPFEHQLQDSWVSTDSTASEQLHAALDTGWFSGMGPPSAGTAMVADVAT